MLYSRVLQSDGIGEGPTRAGAKLPVRLQSGPPVLDELVERINEVLIVFAAINSCVYHGMLQVGWQVGGNRPLEHIGATGKGKTHATAYLLAACMEASPDTKDFATGYCITQHIFN